MSHTLSREYNRAIILLKNAGVEYEERPDGPFVERAGYLTLSEAEGLRDTCEAMDAKSGLAWWISRNRLRPRLDPTF